MAHLVSLLAGGLFAVGLGVSGMTQPQKIVGFLDLFGAWDPALIFVMVGAIAVHSLSYLTLNQNKKPLFAGGFSIPPKGTITKPLIIGSFLFGGGWGLSGFCPGPGVVSLFSGNVASVNFVASMVVGMLVFRFFKNEKREDG